MTNVKLSPSENIAIKTLRNIKVITTMYSESITIAITP